MPHVHRPRQAALGRRPTAPKQPKRNARPAVRGSARWRVTSRGARERGRRGAASLSPTDRPPAPRRAPARPTAGRAFCAAAPRVRLRRWVTTTVVIFERVRLARRCAVAPSFGSVRSFVRRYDHFHDSPWVEGAGCSKFYDNSEWDSFRPGLLCFDAACAPPAVREFDCHSRR